jgi:hypothetical protein
MTTVSVNNVEINYTDSDISNKQSLKSLSNTLLKEQLEAESVITHLMLDGTDYQYEEDSELLNESITNFNTINFQTVNSVDLAFQALDSCQDYIENLSENILKLSQAYQKSDFDNANALFADVIELLDLYIQLISKIYSTIRRNRPSLIENGQAIQNLEIHLLSVLKALVPAKENNDYIMLCDLLEYELIDNLTQWKIKIIPNLKKLRNI